MATRDESNDEAWRELAGWGRERRLTELETSMWRGERHPANATSGAVIELLDATPDWERVRDAHDWMIALVPRLRERIVEPPLPVTPPVWAADPDFDLDYHLRRVRLPAPGSPRQLLDFAQTVVMTPLDRARPPWVGWFVEGLEGDRSAYVLQTHHCLFDGHGVIQLLARVHSRTREPRPDAPVSSRRPFEEPSGLGMLGGAVRGAVPDPLRAGRGLAGALRANPLRAPQRARELASATRRALVPPPTEPSPLLRHSPRRSWRFSTMECGLAELKAAAKAAGGSLNDAYVAAILGGVARYHDHAGVPFGDIPMTMPVSTRRPDDPEGSNRFVAAFIAAPASRRDPRERIAALREVVEGVRGDLAGIDVMGALLPVFNRAPAALLAPAFIAMQNRADLTASNVPGIPFPVYFAGARVERMYFFGPLPGCAVMTVLLSHGETCCISLNTDGEVFGDQELLAGCMREGLDEVLALGRE